MFTGQEILKIVDGAELFFDGVPLSRWGNVEKADNDFSVISVVTDSRTDCSGALFVALSGENFDGHNYLDQASRGGAVALCISAEYANVHSLPSGIPILVVENTLIAYQTLARAHREKMDCTVIAITGSSGKTSTKEILKTILMHVFGKDMVLATEGNTNNHIGVPQNLFRLTEKHRFAVIEMGSNHPGEIEVLTKTALPDISIITSIGNAHTEFFGNTNGVAQEKSMIFAGYPDSSGNIKTPIAVFPASGEENKILQQKAGTVFYTFGNKECTDADLKFEYLGGNLKGSSFRLINCATTPPNPSSTKLRIDKITESPQHRNMGNWSTSIQWSLHGAYQTSNATAAALAALAIGIEAKEIEKAFQKCSLPDMRMQITEKNGITWINDAYNANPDSVKATLDWLAEFANKPSVKIILGDMLEIGESTALFHKQVLEYSLKKLPQAQLFGVGKEMSKTVAASPELQKQVTCYNNSDIAAEVFFTIVQSGDMVFIKGSRGIKMEKICL